MDLITPRLLGEIASDAPLVTGTASRRTGDGTGEPVVRRLLRFVLRWRIYLLAGLAIGALLGVVVTLVMTPQYASTVRLEIARDASRVTKIDGLERDVSYFDQEFYQTQYGLLQSTGLAERVAQDLKLVDDEKFFAMFGEDDLFDPGVKALSDPARRVKRTEVAGRILLDRVNVAPVRGSSLVDVTATTPDASLSRRIASMWAKDFIETSFERRYEASSHARRFLQSRIEALRQALEASERTAVAYAASQGIIELPQAGNRDGNDAMPGGGRSLVTDQLGEMNSALAAATSQRIEAQARLAALRNPGASTEGLGDTALGDMRRERAMIASEYAKTTSQFGPQYPQVLSLAGQLAEMDAAVNAETARVRETLAHSYSAAVQREAALKSRLAALKGDLNDLRRRSIQYNIYLRDADTNRELYNSLLQRYKEIGVAGSVESNNISVINAPKVSERPSSPNLLINFLLAMLAGGIAATALATALSQIDETIKDPDEARDKLGLPVLGSLPRVKTGLPLDALQDPRSPLAEAYQSVQTSLDLATQHGMPRSLAITSSRPREGKSTSAIALSRLLARADRKVVLVDADMRSPSLHTSLFLPNDHGVSNLLSGSDDLASAIHETEREGLFVLTAGPQPPSTVELLSGEGLRNLIYRLLEEFDFVIVDSPPVLGLADAQLVGSAVEAVVFVVEAEAVQAGTARASVDRMHAARANVIGLLLAKFDPEREPFGYGYGYGYGYGSRET